MTNENSPLLFDLFPDLREKIPYTHLSSLPTPVDTLDTLGKELDIGKLIVKRDDLSAEVYGGNKVRKLEFLLGMALHKRAEEVITFGMAGSNHALATAIYAKQVGLRATSMLLPQPNALYVRRNLLAGYASGARLHLWPSKNVLLAQTARRILTQKVKTGKAPFVIMPGGTSPQGIVGAVNSAFELKAQIDAGVLPKPDILYVPIGSMGTGVGLGLGLRAAGIETQIVGVSVYHVDGREKKKIQKLIRSTSSLLRAADPSFPEIGPYPEGFTIRNEFLGEEYARFTDEGREAVRLVGKHADIPLEGTYSGKCFSCLIADARAGKLRDKTVLFWNTHNSRDFAPDLCQADYHELPKAFHSYFEQDVQPE